MWSWMVDAPSPTRYSSGYTANQEECVAVALDGSCTIINTLFFEDASGISTLSQYGMALLVLLMLGIGFVSFRRFAS